MTGPAAERAGAEPLALEAEAWARAGGITRDGWRHLAQAGLVGAGSRTDRPMRALLQAVRRLTVCNDMGIVASYLINEITLRLVTLHLDPAAKAQLQEIREGASNVALCITEPEAGSDLQALATVAEETPSGWALHGKKILVSNGPIADLFAVAARTGPPGRSALRGVTLFLVRRGGAGLDVSGALPKAGIGSMPVGELALAGCEVSKEAVIGRPGRGFQILMEILQFERLTVAVGALAATEMYLARFVPHLQARSVFGRNLGAYDTVRDWMGDVHARLRAAQALVESLIARFDEGVLDTSGILAAKVTTTELLQQTALLITKLSGGHGFLRDHWASNLFDDVRWMSIAGGVNEVLRGLLGNELVHGGPLRSAGAHAEAGRSGG